MQATLGTCEDSRYTILDRGPDLTLWKLNSLKLQLFGNQPLVLRGFGCKWARMGSFERAFKSNALEMVWHLSPPESWSPVVARDQVELALETWPALLLWWQGVPLPPGAVHTALALCVGLRGTPKSEWSGLWVKVECVLHSLVVSPVGVFQNDCFRIFASRVLRRLASHLVCFLSCTWLFMLVRLVRLWSPRWSSSLGMDWSIISPCRERIRGEGRLELGKPLRMLMQSS